VIRIRRIQLDDPLYPQACALREDVLLSTVGWTMDDYRREMPGREEAAEHYVAVADHPQGERVIACACLLPPQTGETAGKVTQVCVDRQRQGEGVGRRLLTSIEARAFGELALEQLYCHAQVDALPFYERLGWRSSGEEFIEAGIPHRKMTLFEPSAALRPAEGA
jgi:predicted GNAT family N-acyltransferase